MRGSRTLSLPLAREVVQSMLRRRAAVALAMPGSGRVRVLHGLRGAGFRLGQRTLDADERAGASREP